MAQSELRQDVISGDWILIARGRKNRPQQFVNKNKLKPPLKRGCIFEHPEKVGGGFPIVVSPPKGSPWLQVVPNKFPAVTNEGIMAVVAKQGPFLVIPGVGHHELVITRDHNNNFPKLPLGDARLVMETFKGRYKSLAEDKYVAYVSIFHNWGPNAGASIYHPHYQIITVPIVPPAVEHALRGSAKYYRENNRCAYCTAIKWEKSQKHRIIYENDNVIAFAPFVSRNPFEVRIFPKKHLPFFEDTSSDILASVTEALHKCLRKIESKLGRPDYNFFLNTAPVVDKNKNAHYHWNIEIEPKLKIEGGFELETGIEINVVDPDAAAEFLRR